MNHSAASASTGPTDFIQKLYRMIDDPLSNSFTHWSEEGDTFLIQDPHDFAKLLLPRHFKHNNFQSFIRQLNKYGFSKVKRNNEDKRWEFKHESFNRNGYDSLKEIKRKAASTRRVSVNTLDNQGYEPLPDIIPAYNYHSNNYNDNFLKLCMEKLDRLEKKYQEPELKFQKILERISSEISNLHKNLHVQDNLMQTMIQCIVSQEKALMLSVDNQIKREVINPIIPVPFSSNIQKLILAYKQVSKVSEKNLDNFYKTFNEFQSSSISSSSPSPTIIDNNSDLFINSPEETTNNNYSYSINNNKLNENEISYSRKNLDSFNSDRCASSNEIIEQPKLKSSSSHSLRKRPRTENLPWTWIVPPNVLLVDDDPTCQKIYARSLQILGCSYEIAKDGVEAVHMMQFRKYDMVLMDIWMPEMDGLSATKKIREFDQTTPIIAITGDYNKLDREFYLKQGINEVLGKPLKINELGPIMQKHWLKFCISRETEHINNEHQHSFNKLSSTNLHSCTQTIIPNYQKQPSSATF